MSTKKSIYINFIKIAEGCDRPCAFCSIPSMRGSFRSRRFGSIKLVRALGEKVLFEGLSQESDLLFQGRLEGQAQEIDGYFNQRYA